MLFNIVVDEVVQALLEEVCSQQEAYPGMRWAAGERNLVFYSGDRRIVGRYHEWVQESLTVTVAMFRRMGLDTNLEKPRLRCVPPG